ncbi:MAG: hypothetical protein QOC57_7 [Ilumatobacteraceae bacterium]|jgi:hypothetical protein
MSNALRNVAETTAHAWSDLVDEARDLVDDARERIEDLPPLARRRRSSSKRWVVMAIVAAVVMMLAMAGKRRMNDKGDRQDATPGARLAEKSMAVS